MSEGECKCKYSAGLALSCFIGVLLSIYALNIEMHAVEDENYEAFCDINESISCTKVFTSKYGKGFGFIGQIFGEDSVLNQPNSLGGIFFYILIGILGFINNIKFSRIQVILCIISNILSIYLAYLLYFVLEDFCIVCVSTYVVNLFNLILSTKRYQLLDRQLKEIKNKTD